MVDWLESIAKDEIGDFSDNIEFYAKSVYWWVQTFFDCIHAPIKCKIHRHRHRITLKKMCIFKSCSVHSLLFFKFLDVKIEISYHPLKRIFSKVSYCFWEARMEGKPLKQLNLILTWMHIWFFITKHNKSWSPADQPVIYAG